VLSEFIMTIFGWMMLFMVSVSGCVFVSMGVAWGGVQNEAQSVAMVVAEQGGYTQTAETAIDGYLQSHNYSSSDTTIAVTSPGQEIPFGEPVEVDITIPWQFDASWFSFPAPMTGVGRAACSYTPTGDSGGEYISP